ncbi:hypothetical protein BDZ94DRAFT_1250239 [Collybia nuda]|uniref:Uncharacterized protein n=1 Tax=Collybia nuda TaxID=64659 RepID=A0A9P5YBM0_9AGAR|nr:hypothetical protein BDZ94DRAFT_1250239 [Collybia nuda]
MTPPTPFTCPTENNARDVLITTTTTTTTTTTAITHDNTRLPCISQPPDKPLLTSISTASPESTISGDSSTGTTVLITSATSAFISSSSTSLTPTPTLEPQTPAPALLLKTKNRGAIIGGTVGGVGSLAVVIGLGFAYRKYRKYRQVSQSAQFSGIREVKTGMSLTSLLPSRYHRGPRPSPFSLIQGNHSSSPINKHNTGVPSENLNPGGPNVDEASTDSESQQGSRAEMEAALQQREILESNLEERLSHRTSNDHDRGRYVGVEQRLRDGIMQMSRRITELELELAVERQVVGLPPPGYVSPIGGSATRS